MKKPIIGIVPLVDIERESYWMLPDVEEAGQLTCVREKWSTEEYVRKSYFRDAF